jgi:hypothetical protein
MRKRTLAPGVAVVDARELLPTAVPAGSRVRPRTANPGRSSFGWRPDDRRTLLRGRERGEATACCRCRLPAPHPLARRDTARGEVTAPSVSGCNGPTADGRSQAWRTTDRVETGSRPSRVQHRFDLKVNVHFVAHDDATRLKHGVEVDPEVAPLELTDRRESGARPAERVWTEAP